MGKLRVRLAALQDDVGMNTAEYAIGTLAAVAVAREQQKDETTDTKRSALAQVIQRALA